MADSAAPASEKPARTRPPSERRVEDDPPRGELANHTPEQALRTFLLALAAQDETTLRAVCMPGEELDWLLKARPRPPSQNAPDRMKQRLERAGFRRLSAGTPVTMPNGRSGMIQPTDVTEGRVVLTAEGFSTPTRVQNQVGIWKVYARPFIVARKAGPARQEFAPPSAP
jgi:hypothetical protein